MNGKRLLLEIQRRLVTLVPGKKVVSTLPGEWTSPFEGRGYEPFGYRDFQIGDDVRRINLPATARRGIPTIVQRVALRDFTVMLVIDDSPSMWVRDKWDIQLKAVALLLFSAWQAETTFGMAVRSGKRIQTFGMGIGSRHFYRLYKALQNFAPGAGTASRMKGATVALESCFPPSTMLFLCSDFLDQAGDPVDLRHLRRTMRRYDFIPVLIQDELEHSFPLLPKGSFIPFVDPESGVRKDAWVSPQAAKAIRAAHEARFAELSVALAARGSRPLHLGSADIEAISRCVGQYFRDRKDRTAA